MKKFVCLLSSLLFLTVFTFSCRIGLGASVDTEPPKISISSPSAGTVIRDTFALKGEVSDDKGIKGIEVVLSPTDSSSSVSPITFTGTYTDDKWSCIVNQNQVPDGTYEAIVTVTDNANHATTASRQFTVDNTPPLVVLQRPNSKIDAENSNTDKYGQKLTIEGQAADDNDVDHIDISIYSDRAQTNLLKTVTLKNVPPTISLDVAEFMEGIDNDYSVIYGKNTKVNAETEYRYLSLKVYDSAQRIPVDGEQSTSDKNGNATTSYYLYDDISGSILNDYKVTEVYHMLNGTYKDTSVISGVKSILDEKSIKGSRFSLNPENSPTYSVTGKNSLAEGDTLSNENKKYYITNDTAQLVVEVKPGLDQSSIVSETVGIYLLKCDPSGKAVEDSEHWIVKPETAWGTYPEQTAEEMEGWIDRKSISGSTYQFTSKYNISTNNYGLEVGADYRVYVIGKDTAGNEFVNSDSEIYGFHLASNGATMSYSLFQKDSFITRNGAKTKPTVTIKIRSTGSDVYWIYRKLCSEKPASNTKSDFSGIEPIASGVDGKGEYKPTGSDADVYSVIYEDKDIELESDTKYIQYFVYDSDITTTSSSVNPQNVYDSTVTLNFDEEKPEVTIVKPADQGTSEFIEDKTTTVRIKTNDNMSGIEKLEYVLSKNSTAPETGWKTVTGSEAEDYITDIYLIEEPDPSPSGEYNFCSEGTWYLYAKATDVVGLVSDVVQHKFNVDAAKPEISLNELKEYTSSNEIINQLNYETIHSNSKLTLSGSVVETNLASNNPITVKVDGISYYPAVDNANNWTLNIPTGTETGTIKENSTIIITVEAKDYVNRTSSKTFKVVYDTKQPTAFVENPNKTYISDETFKFRIWASDGEGSGIKNISYVFSKSSSAPDTGWKTDSSYRNGDKYIDMSLVSGKDADLENNKLCEGEWYLYVKAQDNAGRESEVNSINFMVDKSLPVLSIKVNDKELDQGKTNAFYEEIADDTLPITISMSDTNALDASEPLTVSVDEKEIPLDKNSNWLYDNETKLYTFKLPVGTEDGTLQKDASISVKFVLKDLADRTTEKNYIFYYDTQSPSLVVSSPTDSLAVDTSSYKIKGSVSDDGYGLSELYFELRNTNGTIVKDSSGKDVKGKTTYNSADKKWEADTNTAYPLTVRGGQWYYCKSFGSVESNNAETLDNYKIPLGTQEGALKLYVKAEENRTDTSESANGRTNVTELEIPFSFDTELPNLTESEVGTKGKTTNKTFKLEGKVWDSNAVSSVKITYKDGAETKTVDANFTDAKTEPQTANWTYEFPITTERVNGAKEGELSDGTYSFTITVIDAAGKSSVQQRTVTVDTIKPEITSKSVNSIKGTKIGDNYWFSTNQVPILVEGNDSGSGISKAEYSVDNGTSWSTLAANSTGYEGYATCSAQGANAIKVRITDVAGNIFVSPSDITAYVDTKSPVSCISNITGTKLTNGNNAITVELSDISDDTNSNVEGTFAGIDTTASDNTAVQITKLGTKEVSFKSFYADGKYTITIPKEKLTSEYAGGVVVTVKDKVGNSQTFQIFTLDIDDSKPTVTITKFTDADNSDSDIDVNGTINISGTASDNALSSVKLEYSLNNTSWTEIHKVTGTNNWSVSGIDTKTAFGNVADGTEIQLKAIAKDAAGNIGESDVYTIVIDQKTDKPVINHTNLTKGTDDSYILKYGQKAQLSGIVKDDDSTSSEVVKLFIAAGSEITEVTKVSDTQYTVKVGGTDVTYSLSNSNGKQIWTNPNGEITTYTPISGDWIFQPADTSDTSHNVYFYIKDNENSVFYTNGSTEPAAIYTRPYIDYKGSNKTDNNAVLTYKSDSNSPAVTGVSCQAYDSNSEVNGSSLDVSTSLTLGGTKKKFGEFTISANDGNGITGMSVTVGYGSTVVYRYTTAAKIAEDIYATSGSEAYTVSSTNFTPTTNSTVSIWKLPELDFSSFPTGEVKIYVKAYDTSSMYGIGTFSFMVDNSAPYITGENNIPKISPSSISEQTGDFTISGTNADIGNAGVSYIKWAIPTSAQRTAADSKTTAAEKNAYYKDNLTWIHNTSSDSSWSFVFKETAEIAGETIYPFTAYDSPTYYISLTEGVYTIPVYFLLEDTLGNYDVVTSYSVKHNPDADKPVTTITYPSESDYDKDSSGNSLGYATVGGTIRVTGGTDIPSGSCSTEDMFIQIGTGNSASNISWNKDATFLSSYTKYVYTNAFDDGEITGGWNTVIADSEHPTAAETAALNAEKAAWWGIKADKKNANWWKAININGELDPTGENSTAKYWLRACAINENGKLGNWTSTPIQISVDIYVPTASVTLTQYSADLTKESISSLTPNPISSQVHTDGMFLKGKWYLTVLLTDNSGVITYYVKEDNLTLSANEDYFVEEFEGKPEGYTENRKGYYLYIPITKTSGSVTYTISGTDASPATMTKTYTVNLDNEAPQIKSLNGNALNLLEPKDGRYDVAESQYVYTLSGTTDDGRDGSGWSKQLFYFMRNSTDASVSNKTYVFDPVKPASGDYENKVSTDNLEELTITQDATHSYNLYGKKIVGKIDSTTTFTPDTATEVSTNQHIRAGSLIYVGGMYRTVTQLSSGVVTFTPALSSTQVSSTQNVDAVFIYAQVIDTKGESCSDNSQNPFNISSDDGDGVVETYSNSGTTYTWSGTIHSTNLPDGPATLVVLAFDEAGNVSGITKPVMIANNAPRLAKVFFGTDLDGNNTFGESEFVEYNIYGAQGSYQSKYTLDFDEKRTTNAVETAIWSQGRFKIKDKLAVVAEFIGGNLASENADIKMVFNNSASNTNAVTGTGADLRDSASHVSVGSTKSAAFGSAEQTIDSVKYTVAPGTLTGIANNNSMYSYVIPGGLGADSDSKGMSFTFWDQTDESVQGTNSQNTVLYVKNFVVDQLDENCPEVTISPFYWKDSTHNSLVSRDKGHIELPDDWEKGNGYDSTAETGVSDADPKVSGEVVISGSAQDDKRLSSIWIALDKTSDSNTVTALSSSTTLEAADEFDFNHAGNAVTASGHTYYKVADFTTEGWKELSDSDCGWTFKVSNNSLKQSGHTVDWSLTWDSSKITDAAQSDVNFRVIALDSRETENAQQTKVNNAAQDSKYAKGNASEQKSYRVDVVPYITKVTTSLSAMYKSDGSVYSRTALGKYPVKTSSTIKVEGFNFNKNSLSASLNGTNLTLSGITSTSFNADIGTTAKSGDFVVTSNNIGSLNNSNYNDANGSDENLTAGDYLLKGYNRCPNGVNNNNLTDDVQIDVWEFIDAANPRNGKSDNPTMKISSQGRIGISFSNAVVYFSAPFIDNGDTQALGNIKSQTAIAQNYGWFTNNTFCFDPYGYPYAAAQSPDTDTATGAAFLQFFSRKAGKAITSMGLNENYQKIKNSARIEAICIPINKDESDWTTDIDRTQSIAMVATMPTPTSEPDNANNKVTVHMAYWDNLTKQIRYRQGQVGSDPENFGFVKKYGINYGQYHNFGGSLCDLEGSESSKETQDHRYNKTYDSISQKNNNGDNLVKTQKIYRVAGTSLGDGYANAYKVTTSHQGGRFVDIGVLSSTATTATPTVVICWYDMINKNLVLSYDTPSDDDTKADDGMCSGNWAARARTISNIGGMYCRMAIDANDGIHIAHYDNTGADLLYTFVPCKTENGKKVPDMANAQTFTVDSFLSVGTWCTIDVAKVARENGGFNYVPQIGYFVPANQDTSAASRIATPVKFDADGNPTFNGAEEDKYTGNWEITTVPTDKIPIIDRVNVGVYKDKDGVQQAVPAESDNSKGISKVVSAVNKPGYPVSDSTTVYGNGTMNPIVVYSVDDGPVEMAQRK
ncbi:MAG: Ig-like domain-containing protein [Treponema sp.]|nr:Ig-like domain-containing protein [Treponema sp.]